MVSFALLDFNDQAPVQWWNFDEREAIRIGRALENDVVVRDPLVSRYHVELRKMQLNSIPLADQLQKDNWQLTNQGKNGTFLNRNFVLQAIITNGDIIQLAPKGPKLQVFFKLQDVLPKHSASSLVNKFSFDLTRPQSQFLECTFCGCTINLKHALFCIQCGNPLQIWETIRHYQILKLLSQGGMGTTFLARHTNQSQHSKPEHQGAENSGLVVLKRMNPEVSELPKARELFAREANTLQHLQHPGIPEFIDFFAEGDQLYLVMELIHGQNLEHYVVCKGKVSPAQAIYWVSQICDILDYLHHQVPPILHRDIKPSNILLRYRDNRIMVVDFGAVKPLVTTTGTHITAAGYTAPEQEKGRPCIQSDLYSLGATLVFLLTGENPLSIHQYQAQEPLYYQEIVPTIKLSLATVLSRILSPDVDDRYASAQALKAALLECS